MCVYIYICINRDTKLCSFFDFHHNEVNCWKGGYGKRMPGTDLRLHRKDLLSSLSFPESGWFVAVLLDSRVGRSVVIIGYLYLIKQQRQDNDFTLTLRQIFFDLLSFFVMFIVSFDSNCLSYSISTKCIGGSNILNALFIYLFSGGSRLQTSSNCIVEYLCFLHFLYLLLFSVMRFSLFCGNSLLFLYFLFANMCFF